MLTKIACATFVLTVASLGPAHAGGLPGGLLGGGSKGGLINVSPNVNLGLKGLLSNNSLLNGNKTSVLSGNDTSVDGIGNHNNNDRDRGWGKKRRR